MNDDPLPNSTTTFYAPGIPSETERLNKEESDKAIEAGSYLESVIAWFDDAIAATDSIAAAQAEAVQRKKPVEAICDAYDITRGLLEQKRNELVSLISTLNG